MAWTRKKNPFFEFFKYYQVPPKDKLPFIGQSDSKPDPGTGPMPLNPGSQNHPSSTLRKGQEGQNLVKRDHSPSEAFVATNLDHFEGPVVESRNGISHTHANGVSQAEFHLPSMDVSGIFIGKQHLFNQIQAEVKQLLHAMHINSQLSPREASVLSSSSLKNLPAEAGKKSTYQSLPTANFSVANATQEPKSAQSFSWASQWSVQNVGNNFIRGSLHSAGFNSESASEMSLRVPSSSQTITTSAQRFFSVSNPALSPSYVSAALWTSLRSPPASESLHLIQWTNQLGVPPQLLPVLLPALIQFQESAPQAKAFLQGFILLFGLLAAIPQNNISNLSWVLLKGMLVFENHSQILSSHSPLLDELGALLSTSRRRLRKEAKKRISNVDKVSRKDSFLAEADPQENEEELEALIDLWPKKESNSSSTAFYYM